MIFDAFPKQVELFNAIINRQNSVVVYGGAMGGAKTWGGLAALILLSKRYAGSKWVVMRASTPTLKKTTIPSFNKIYPRSFIQQFNHSDNVVTFKNGSQIIFMAESFTQNPDLQHLKGLECNGFLLEQMEELQEDTLDICLLRIGRWITEGAKQPPNVIIATVNPAFNWVKTKIYDAWIKDELPKYKKYTDDNGVEHEELGWNYISAKISDNPVLFNNKTYMANFNNLDPITYDRYVNGNWEARDKSGLFCYQFDPEKHTFKEYFNHKKTKHITLSFDFNVSPATCTAWQIGADFIHCIKEFRIDNCDVYQMCDEVRAAFPKNVFRITGDASGNNRAFTATDNKSTWEIIENELNSHEKLIHNDVPTRNPSIRNSRELINAILIHFNDFKIHSSCKFTIEDLISVKATADGGINKKDLTRGHLLDAVRYLVWTYYKEYITDYNLFGNDDEDYEY